MGPPSCAQVMGALKEVSLTLLESLSVREVDRTSLRLSALWPVAISLGARAIVLCALLEEPVIEGLRVEHLLTPERCAELITLRPLSAEKSSKLRAWLITWAPEVIEPLLPATPAKSYDLDVHLSLNDRLKLNLPELFKGLGEAYEQLIGLSLQGAIGDTQQLEWVEGGLRQANGSYYTPPWLITHILTLTLDLVAQDQPPTMNAPLTLLDPACGVGRFLVQGTLRQAELIGETRAREPLASLISHAAYGVDLDPHAVELCRGWLWALGDLNETESASLCAHIRCGDALLSLPPHLGSAGEPLAHWRLSFPERVREGRALFDVIVGNPPYIDSEQMKRASPEERALLCERFRGCKGNWDLFVPFIELSLALLSPQGAQAMVTPKQLIGADYSASIQRLLLQRPLTHLIDCRQVAVFQDADVEVLVLVARGAACHEGRDGHLTLSAPDPSASYALQAIKRFPQRTLSELPHGHWGFALSVLPDQQELFELWRGALKLGEVTQISDGATTNEAYHLRALLMEASSSTRTPAELLAEGQVALVNTGLIDPFERLWGDRPARYLKSDWVAPTLSVSELRAHFPKRAAQALSAKVLIAGLARRVEAVVAPPGVLCGKSARQLIPQEGVCEYALCALLNSQLTHQLYGALFGLRGLSRSWSVGSRQLAALPVPARQWLQPSELNAALLNAKEPELSALSAHLERDPQRALSSLGKVLHRWPQHEPLLELLERVVRSSFQR